MQETLIFLQTEIHGYHISLINELHKNYGFHVIIFYWDKDKKTPFIPPEIEGVELKRKVISLRMRLSISLKLKT